MQSEILEQLSAIANKEMTPEERAEVVKKLASALPSSLLDEARKDILAQDARKDSPEGYAAFYELMHGFAPPPHIMQEIRAIYKAHAEGIGCLVFAWRGSWKTVSISVTFIAHRIGLEPGKTNMVVSANDDSAEKVTKATAAMIEFHPEWKRAFPSVIPDTGRWSVEGFSVVDSSISREAWAEKQSGVIDPTLVGGGYKSSRLIGKHPTGVLDIDDIHDLDNARSERERGNVVEILTKTILKTVVKENDRMTTWLIAVGTPWALDDAYYTMRNTGQYEFVNIPAMVKADEKTGVYVDGKNRDGTVFDDVVGWWKLTHPERFGVNSVVKERADGKSSFWQMIMLDLATAETGRLRYQQFPHDQIDPNWTMLGGADPTNDDNVTKGSHFALAFVATTPTWGAVVVDGILERCSQLTAENHIISAQRRFPGWQYVAVENIGGGAGFIQTLQRNPEIRVMPSGLKSITDAKVKNKRDRALEMSKWFEDGTVKISDADTPFLNALRRMFDKFWDLDPYHDYSFDAWDAVYHALKNMPNVLRVNSNPLNVRPAMKHPLSGIRTHVGYGVR